jgi:lipoic acid synthetase
MSSLKNIPVVAENRAPRSGEKYLTPQGFTAIKDGQKPRGAESPSARVGKPRWITAPLAAGAGFSAVKGIVREHRLATVCEEAKCPNIGECWNAGTATIMLMGAVCTRACRFCSVDTGNPRGWLDAEEPENTARSVELMKLKYIVLTSVNRDDLPDGGARHYADAIRAIKRRTPHVAVEALTPDFQGVMKDVETVIDSGLDVFAQNVETVRRLTHPVRDPRAGYEQTIAVLAHAKRYKPSVLTKTSLMLGLGETDEEIAQCMDDLRTANVDLLTLGQYLRPTMHHLPVQRFVTPAEFDKYRQWALAKGFRECVSGPLVRSSYRAEQAVRGAGWGKWGLGDENGDIPDLPAARANGDVPVAGASPSASKSGMSPFSSPNPHFPHPAPLTACSAR